MPKKGENIYKRKDGRWEGRYIKGYHADGKAKYAYVYRDTDLPLLAQEQAHAPVLF